MDTPEPRVVKKLEYISAYIPRIAWEHIHEVAVTRERNEAQALAIVILEHRLAALKSP